MISAFKLPLPAAMAYVTREIQASPALLAEGNNEIMFLLSDVVVISDVLREFPLLVHAEQDVGRTSKGAGRKRRLRSKRESHA